MLTQVPITQVSGLLRQQQQLQRQDQILHLDIRLQHQLL